MASRFIVYGRSTCPYCTLALELLRSREKENVYFDFSEDPAAVKEAMEFYDWPTVPMVLENDLTTGETKFIGGYADLLGHLDE